MADRIRSRTPRNKPVSEIDSYYPDPHRTLFRDKIRFEDLIGSLARAHENRRVLQVTEWEAMPRQIFRFMFEGSV